MYRQYSQYVAVAGPAALCSLTKHSSVVSQDCRKARLAGCGHRDVVFLVSDNRHKTCVRLQTRYMVPLHDASLYASLSVGPRNVSPACAIALGGKSTCRRNLCTPPPTNCTMARSLVDWVARKHYYCTDENGADLAFCTQRRPGHITTYHTRIYNQLQVSTVSGIDSTIRVPYEVAQQQCLHLLMLQSGCSCTRVLLGACVAAAAWFV